jgi:hypothetical protein
VHPCDGLLNIVQQQAFGQFQLQTAGLNLMLCYCFQYRIDKVILAELFGTDINRHRH